MSDEERQMDEVFVLQNIMDSNDFRCIRNADAIECLFLIKCDLKMNNIQIKHDALVGTNDKLQVKHLPPVRLYIQLPIDYPSTSPPKFSLVIDWLPPYQVSIICQKLDELWQANLSNEILFIWFEFLKNELVDYLELQKGLNVTYLYDLHLDITDQYLSEVIKWKDSRVIYGSFSFNPIEKLLDYNEHRELVEFESNIQECEICFATYYGKMCVKIKTCCHVFCRECILQFLKMKIDERDVRNIKCPGPKCKSDLKSGQLEEICPSDLFQKYEKYLLEIKLKIRGNLVYCPRKTCQTPVETKDGESLASCPVCEYNFCAYCLKVYHGVMACDMDSTKKLRLIEEYKNGNKVTQRILEKKYGKNQIRQIVEKQLVNDYLKEYTKHCPTCGVLVAKVSGCNLVNCSQCSTNFCWLCGSQILENSYDHYKTTNSGPCTGRLFEGAGDPNVDDRDAVPDFDFIQELRMVMRGFHF